MRCPLRRPFLTSPSVNSASSTFPIGAKPYARCTECSSPVDVLSHWSGVRWSIAQDSRPLLRLSSGTSAQQQEPSCKPLLSFGDATEELRTLLLEAGFHTVRIRSDVRMVRFASPEAFVRHQVAGSPLASHVAQVDEAARRALVREVSAAMQAYVNDEGVAFPIEGHILIAHP